MSHSDCLTRLVYRGDRRACRILDQHKVAAEIAQLRESNSRVAAVAEQRLREIERLLRIGRRQFATASAPSARNSLLDTRSCRLSSLGSGYTGHLLAPCLGQLRTLHLAPRNARTPRPVLHHLARHARELGNIAR
jgi:hypothetical protein